MSRNVSHGRTRIGRKTTFRGHFEFGLKYERLNFEFLSRLFQEVGPDEVAHWVRDKPTGAYASHRARFLLYEWFTGKRLDVPDTANAVAYADAIDSDLYLTGRPAETDVGASTTTSPERVRSALSFGSARRRLGTGSTTLRVA